MFNKRLAKLRHSKGLTQMELAKKMGMARTTYSGYESGSREPDFKTLSKLADFFEVDIDWLLTGEEENKDVLYQNDLEVTKIFNQLREEDQIYILDFMKKTLKLNSKE